MTDFIPFDPLEAKITKASDAAFEALRREIRNILSSYVGWYDPFCELIQNALDAVDARVSLEESAGTDANYKPTVKIFIDLVDNSLTVTDNGIGLDESKFEQFLAPNFSFDKSNKTRGHKGVGATYVVYGFNYMRVSTKIPGYQASGRIINARKWLDSQAAGGNPKVEPDNAAHINSDFSEVDRGVSITVRFDGSTQPKRLDWIKAKTADQWKAVLSIKTGLGAIFEDKRIKIELAVKSDKGMTSISWSGISYLWLYTFAAKKASFKELVKTQDDLYKKYGAGRPMPDRFKNLEFIFGEFDSNELLSLVGSSLDEEEKDVLSRFAPVVSFEYGYTAKIWPKFNEQIGIRANHRVVTSGFQLAANNMPQGETHTVPLNRNIGRQNQIHFLIHFSNYTPDMGRKGFHRELVDFSKVVTRALMENHLSKFRLNLKANTGVPPDLARELAIDEWKASMTAHENTSPLKLTSKHFFLPAERVSMTSVPTREQDVIALFHQLIAGGVLRGLNIMSTNERFTYDGLFRISFDLENKLYIYHQDSNPLGVSAEVAEALSGKVTSPKVLEYKFSLDGLIEDFANHDKNIKDVDLCVVWETGESYKERYGITSLLMSENVEQRPYHGISHILIDLETGSRNCDLIVLKELIAYLNDPDKQSEKQRIKYD